MSARKNNQINRCLCLSHPHGDSTNNRSYISHACNRNEVKNYEVKKQRGNEVTSQQQAVKSTNSLIIIPINNNTEKNKFKSKMLFNCVENKSVRFADALDYFKDIKKLPAAAAPTKSKSELHFESGLGKIARKLLSNSKHYKTMKASGSDVKFTCKCIEDKQDKTSLAKGTKCQYFKTSNKEQRPFDSHCTKSKQNRIEIEKIELSPRSGIQCNCDIIDRKDNKTKKIKHKPLSLVNDKPSLVGFNSTSSTFASPEYQNKYESLNINKKKHITNFHNDKSQLNFKPRNGKQAQNSFPCQLKGTDYKVLNLSGSETQFQSRYIENKDDLRKIKCVSLKKSHEEKTPFQFHDSLLNDNIKLKKTRSFENKSTCECDNKPHSKEIMDNKPASEIKPKFKNSPRSKILFKYVEDQSSKAKIIKEIKDNSIKTLNNVQRPHEVYNKPANVNLKLKCESVKKTSRSLANLHIKQKSKSKNKNKSQIATKRKTRLPIQCLSKLVEAMLYNHKKTKQISKYADKTQCSVQNFQNKAKFKRKKMSIRNNIREHYLFSSVNHVQDNSVETHIRNGMKRKSILKTEPKTTSNSRETLPKNNTSKEKLKHERDGRSRYSREGKDPESRCYDKYLNRFNTQCVLAVANGFKCLKQKSETDYKEKQKLRYPEILPVGIKSKLNVLCKYLGSLGAIMHSQEKIKSESQSKNKHNEFKASTLYQDKLKHGSKLQCENNDEKSSSRYNDNVLTFFQLKKYLYDTKSHCSRQRNHHKSNNRSSSYAENIPTHQRNRSKNNKIYTLNKLCVCESTHFKRLITKSFADFKANKSLKSFKISAKGKKSKLNVLCKCLTSHNLQFIPTSRSKTQNEFKAAQDKLKDSPRSNKSNLIVCKCLTSRDPQSLPTSRSKTQNEFKARTAQDKLKDSPRSNKSNLIVCKCFTSHDPQSIPTSRSKTQNEFKARTAQDKLKDSPRSKMSNLNVLCKCLTSHDAQFMPTNRSKTQNEFKARTAQNKLNDSPRSKKSNLNELCKCLTSHDAQSIPTSRSKTQNEFKARTAQDKLKDSPRSEKSNLNVLCKCLMSHNAQFMPTNRSKTQNEFKARTAQNKLNDSPRSKKSNLNVLCKCLTSHDAQSIPTSRSKTQNEFKARTAQDKLKDSPKSKKSNLNLLCKCLTSPDPQSPTSRSKTQNEFKARSTQDKLKDSPRSKKSNLNVLCKCLTSHDAQSPTSRSKPQNEFKARTTQNKFMDASKIQCQCKNNENRSFNMHANRSNSLLKRWKNEVVSKSSLFRSIKRKQICKCADKSRSSFSKLRKKSKPCMIRTLKKSSKKKSNLGFQNNNHTSNNKCGCFEKTMLTHKKTEPKKSLIKRLYDCVCESAVNSNSKHFDLKSTTNSKHNHAPFRSFKLFFRGKKPGHKICICLKKRDALVYLKKLMNCESIPKNCSIKIELRTPTKDLNKFMYGEKIQCKCDNFNDKMIKRYCRREPMNKARESPNPLKHAETSALRNKEYNSMDSSRSNSQMGKKTETINKCICFTEDMIDKSHHLQTRTTSQCQCEYVKDKSAPTNFLKPTSNKTINEGGTQTHSTSSYLGASGDNSRSPVLKYIKSSKSCCCHAHNLLSENGKFTQTKFKSTNKTISSNKSCDCKTDNLLKYGSKIKCECKNDHAKSTFAKLCNWLKRKSNRMSIEVKTESTKTIPSNKSCDCKTTNLRKYGSKIKCECKQDHAKSSFAKLCNWLKRKSNRMPFEEKPASKSIATPIINKHKSNNLSESKDVKGKSAFIRFWKSVKRKYCIIVNKEQNLYNNNKSATNNNKCSHSTSNLCSCDISRNRIKILGKLIKSTNEKTRNKTLDKLKNQKQHTKSIKLKKSIGDKKRFHNYKAKYFHRIRAQGQNKKDINKSKLASARYLNRHFVSFHLDPSKCIGNTKRRRLDVIQNLFPCIANLVGCFKQMFRCFMLTMTVFVWCPCLVFMQFCKIV